MASSRNPEDVLRVSPEKTNHTRVTKLLISGGTAILRELFDYFHPPANLLTVLTSGTVYLTLKDMQTKKFLTFPQWRILFPSPGTCGQSKTFDITLLCKLLRNICNLTAPATRWDILPNSTDLSLTADIARIKYFRNEIYGHVNEAMELRDEEFVRLWDEIKDALIRIVKHYSTSASSSITDWKNAIENLLTAPLTDEDEMHLDELKHWYLEDMEVKKTLEETRRTAEETKRIAEETRSGTEETRRTAEETRSGTEETRRTAEETKRTAEETRSGTEETRRIAEETRSGTEETRRIAEEIRSGTEETRRTAEETRRTAEETKRTAEETKRTAEGTKKITEVMLNILQSTTLYTGTTGEGLQEQGKQIQAKPQLQGLHPQQRLQGPHLQQQFARLHMQQQDYDSNVTKDLTFLQPLLNYFERFEVKGSLLVAAAKERGKNDFHLILELFQKGLHLSDKTVRQDVLHEAIELLKSFSPAKVANTWIVNIPDADVNSPLHYWASLELPSPQDYTSNVTKDLTFGEFLETLFNFFVRCGVTLNARNRYDQTPLHLCKTWIAVMLLLDAGVKAKDVDSSGASPLVVAAKERLYRGYQGRLYPDCLELEDPKSFWETAIDKGLDPWTADQTGKSVLSILIELDEFILAKALVDVACERKYTQTETFAVALLNAICKDKSTRKIWKRILVQDVLKSRKGPTAASEPLRLCCRNIIDTGVLDINKAAKECNDDDDGQPTSRKRRMDTSISSIQAQIEHLSVHCEIIKILRVYGADGNSCLDLADSSDALKELLTEPLDFNTVSVFIPWTSTSKKYEVKLAKVARRQECKVIHKEYWCHKEHVGSGSYGDVFVGINEKDGREVAVKRIVKLRMQRPDKREITNLTVLADCEQIVRYLYFFEEEKFSYIVLELMEGNLDEYLTDDFTFDDTKSTPLCQDVVKGLKFLHKQNIIHCDLKPGNILYKTHPRLRLKISDFGISRRIDRSATTVYGTNAGTRCWMAPELLMCISNHSKASDIFSCGLVLHYILSVQKHPYSKNNSQMPHEIETNITNGRIEGWDDCLFAEATHLVKNMLSSDENDRPTAVKALDHPMFWSNKKKMDVLVAVGNQSEFGYPRAIRKTLTAVEADLEKSFSTIVVHETWNNPSYANMPSIYAEMTFRKRSYDTHSVVELVRFIRNAYAQVSESTRPTAIRKMLLEDFVFLEYFPHLVMEVYKVVTDHGWVQTVEEIKYAMNE